MRLRLKRMLDFAEDLRRATGRRGERPAPPPGEQHSAEEMKRRLDQTRERLKRETPPKND
jgi:hypothetical protein